jgi:hypothetical protein
MPAGELPADGSTVLISIAGSAHALAGQPD